VVEERWAVLYCPPAMKRRWSAMVLSTVLAVLMLSVVPSGASSTAKQKPKYRVVVKIYGAKKITGGCKYTYRLVVKNTGRKKLKKVRVQFKPAEFIVAKSLGFKLTPGSNPEAHSTATWTLKNVRAGTTRRITIRMVYPPSTEGDFWGLQLSARGVGTSGFATKNTVVYYK
jgi:hypothetical protein